MAISSVLGSSALLPAGLGFRNTIMNGGFIIDQRNASASQTITSGAALAYTTDRWYAYCTGANVTGQQVAGSAPFQYNYKFTGATSNTAIGFGQRIEAANSFNYAGATATLSAYIKSSSLTSITWTLYYATTIDSFGTVASPTRTQIATGTFTISATLTRYSTQISVPAASTTGLELVFTTGALVASQTLEFTGVQLEQNYQPTPFEQRPIGVELALCQRYFYKATFTGGSLAFATGYAATANIFYWSAAFPVTMRGVPSLAQSSMTVDINVGGGALTGAMTTKTTAYTYGAYSGITTIMTAGQGGVLQSSSSASYIQADAEL